MHPLDWLLVFIPVSVVVVLAIYMRRHLHSVADFMAGGRNAGRYLLCTARSEMGAGAVAFVAFFEIFQRSGFSLRWWNQLSLPVGLLVMISGFVIYRFRQTRALTLAQFFEMRYSRRFRLFTGGLAVFAGLCNFGIMPVIGARLMVYFLDFPATLHFFGWAVPTYLVLMAFFLTVCTVMTVSGGQITVMLTDCVQGMFSQVFYLVIAVAVLLAFNWPQTHDMLLAQPPGQSLINPFDSAGTRDFNIWFVLIGIFNMIYGTMAWQNSSGFNAAAATPHEARMGAILGGWRAFALSTMMVLLAVCAMTYIHQPEGAAAVNAALERIPDAQTAKQMHLATGLSQILPVGIKGLLVAVMVMGIFGGDGMHLHSWSSIFIQDVVMPMRKKPLSTRQHLRLLRLSVVAVAIFAFCFGALFPQTEYVAMWFIVTMGIYIGGAGACIIGGLYWSRGTTAGAWTGLLTGSLLSTGGILLRQKVSVPVLEWFLRNLGAEGEGWAHWLLAHVGEQIQRDGVVVTPGFPLNGAEISFYAALLAVAAYVTVSLLTCRNPHNMDKLLHRGEFAVKEDAVKEGVELPAATAAAPKPRSRFHPYALVGIDENFTRRDRWVSLGIFFWSIFWVAVFAVGSLAYLAHPWSDEVWGYYWLITGIGLPLLIAAVTTVWFTIGCWQDIRLFFARLKTETVDERDDGSVA